jgi:hypothetical protein
VKAAKTIVVARAAAKSKERITIEIEEAFLLAMIDSL